MFALGTYLLNQSEDGTSEMRITIDQTVGSALLQLLNDGSPIVRKVMRVKVCVCVRFLNCTQELVTALHGLTLLYEKQFHIAALHFSEGKRISASNLTTSVTPTGWIHVTIDPPENEPSNEGGTNIPTPNAPPAPISGSLTGNSVANSFEGPSSHTHNEELAQSSGAFHGDPANLSRGSLVNGEGEGRRQFLEDLPKGKGAAGGGAGPGGVAARNWYQQILRGMVYLASDPFPEVADLAQNVVHSLHDKVSNSHTVQEHTHTKNILLNVW